MALIVLDASVLIALLDSDDALHGPAAEVLRLYAGDDLRIPASAYSESLTGAARHGRLGQARAAIAALLAEVVPLTEYIAGEAAELVEHHPALRVADALVVATGSVLDADVVLTGDAGWRPLSSSVRVVGQD